MLHHITHWESWHYHTKYIPLTPLWLWYCLRAKSMWFFTTSNPTITFGGFEGEGKQEIYQQMPSGSFPDSIFIGSETDFERVLMLLEDSALSFPLVVKPDKGIMGYMFRRLHNADQLKRYHDFIGMNYIIQRWVEYPMEVSAFYYRMPGNLQGKVTGFLMKQPPIVTGDGKTSLKQLILKNEDLKYKSEELLVRHREHLQMVLPHGKVYALAYASNRSQGGKLISLSHEIDDRLVTVLDNISNFSGSFFYGRFDIKCTSLESLKNNRDFLVLEYNGAGAGIQHIYGNHLSLNEALRTIARHWKILYRISTYNHRVNKVPYWPYLKGRRFLKQALRHTKLLAKQDAEFPA